MFVINTDVWFLTKPFLNLKPGEVVEISEKLTRATHFFLSRRAFCKILPHLPAA